MLRTYFNRLSAGGVAAFCALAVVGFAGGLLFTDPGAAVDAPEGREAVWNQTKATLRQAWDRAVFHRKEWLLKAGAGVEVSMETLEPAGRQAEEAALVEQRLEESRGQVKVNRSSRGGCALADILLLAGGGAHDGEDVRHANRADSGGSTPNPDFRFQASLWWDGLDSPLCGAAVLDERNLVTAAHCLYDGVMRPTRRPVNFLRITVGSTDYLKASSYEVGYTYTHPYFDTLGVDNDVAVVRLKKAMNLGEEVRSIPVASGPPVPGTVCQLSGWGAWANRGDANATELRHMDVVVLTPDKCLGPRDSDVTTPLICVAPKNGDAYTHADDGGPLTCSGQLVGVVVRNGRQGLGITITDVSLHAAFVAESLAHPGRGAWPFMSSLLAGTSVAAVCLTVTAVLARLSDS